MADPPPSFGWFVASLALRSAFDPGYVRKRFLRKEWVVPLGAPLMVGTLVFQSGAVLGYTRPNNADALMSLLSWVGHDKTLSNGETMRRLAEHPLKNLRREPKRLDEVWNGAVFPEIDLTDVKVLERLAKEEIRLGTLMQQVDRAIVFGVAFGMTYPTDFERLWRQTFETLHDENEWQQMRSAGLAIPERQETYPLSTARTDTLNQTGAYARAFRPDLLAPLDLANYGME